MLKVTEKFKIVNIMLKYIKKIITTIKTQT